MKKLFILCSLLLISIGVYADNNWLYEYTKIYSNSRVSVFANTLELQNIAFSSYQEGNSFTLDLIFHIKDDQEWDKLLEKTNYNINENSTSYVMLGDLDQAKYLKREIEFDFFQNKATILKEYFIDGDNNIITWHSLRKEHDLINDKLFSKIAQNIKNIFEIFWDHPN